MVDNYVTMIIKKEGKVVLIVTCDEDTRYEGFLWDIIEQYTLPCYEITIKTQEILIGEDLDNGSKNTI